MWTDAVELAVAAYLELPGKPEEEVRTRLSSLGLSGWLVARLMLWVPLAFGRELLGEIAFPPTYTVKGDATAVPLADDPIFRAAALRAKRMTREEADAIAVRSGEVSVVSKYLVAASERGEDVPLEEVPVPSLELGATPPTGADDGGIFEPRAVFAELVRARGLPVVARPEGGAACGDLVFDAVVFPTLSRGPMRGQIDYVVRHPRLAAGVVVESNAAVGSSWKEAVSYSLRNFAQSSLPVMLAALVGDGMGGEGIELDAWAHPNGAYRAVMGPHFFTGPDPVDVAPLVRALRAAFGQEDLSRAVHSIRVFTGRQGEQVFGEDAQLDGASWPLGVTALQAFPWPVRGEFYSSRLFMLLVPVDEAGGPR
jgi:hypothetical protein